MSFTASPYHGFFSSLSEHASARKPDFSSVPPGVRADLCRLVQAQSISHAETARGGITASAAFLVTFDTGTRLFIKGSHPAELSHGAANLRGECAAYRGLDVLHDVAPLFAGMVYADAGDDNGWWLGAWQALDVNRESTYDAASLFSLVDAFSHCGDLSAVPVASGHPYLGLFMNDAHKWQRLRDEQSRAQKFTDATEDVSAARAWFDTHIHMLCAMQAEAARHSWRMGLIHGDLRCDNFIFARADAVQAWRWYTVDWANAAEGPLAFDRCMLAASLLAEGAITRKAAAVAALGDLDSADVSHMLVQQAGYFADQLYRAAPPALPHLRPMQKAMAWALLSILAEMGVLSDPPVFSRI